MSIEIKAPEGINELCKVRAEKVPEENLRAELIKAYMEIENHRSMIFKKIFGNRIEIYNLEKEIWEVSPEIRENIDRLKKD